MWWCGAVLWFGGVEWGKLWAPVLGVLWSYMMWKRAPIQVTFSMRVCLLVSLLLLWDFRAYYSVRLVSAGFNKNCMVVISDKVPGDVTLDFKLYDRPIYSSFFSSKLRAKTIIMKKAVWCYLTYNFKGQINCEIKAILKLDFGCQSVLMKTRGKIQVRTPQRTLPRL